MFILIAMFALAATPAWAQPLQSTVPVTAKGGEQIGTATFSGNKVYLRNKSGEHYATIEHNKDGSRTAYDENGNVLWHLPLSPK